MPRVVPSIDDLGYGFAGQGFALSSPDSMAGAGSCQIAIAVFIRRKPMYQGLLLPGGPTGPTSVDVQHGFAADAAVEQGADRLGGLAPGAFQLDLGVEAAVCGQGAQARQVAGPAGVRGEFAGEVQRVDPRPGSTVEALGL